MNVTPNCARSLPIYQRGISFTSWKNPFCWWATTGCREDFWDSIQIRDLKLDCASTGAPNELMHVLLHELAHATVKEYDHSPAFWANLDELKEFTEGKKLYKTIEDPKGFCGARIHD